MSRHEVPTAFPAAPPYLQRADNPYEALMSAAPGDTIEASKLEMLALRDLLSDAIDALEPRYRWVLEQTVIHRIPLRAIAEWMNLSKTYVAVIRDEALAQLREQLSDHPAIVAYLGRHDEPNEEE